VGVAYFNELFSYPLRKIGAESPSVGISIKVGSLFGSTRAAVVTLFIGVPEPPHRALNAVLS